MSIDLGRRLVTAGLVSPGDVEAALFISVVRGVPLTRVLLDRGAITERALEDELERAFGLEQRQVVGAADLVARLPRAMCRRLAAVPTRLDAETNTVDVVAADPLDPHIKSEFGFHLEASIRLLRAPIAAVEEAIRRIELAEPEAPSAPRTRQRRMTPPFPHGAPESTASLAADETPIPLVRRIAGAGDEAPTTAQQPASSEEEKSEPLLLRNAKYIPPPEREPPREQPTLAMPVQPLAESEAEPASSRRISPSETPPYGTQVTALRRPVRRPSPAPASAKADAVGDASNRERPPRTLRPPLMAPAAPPDPAREWPYAPAPLPVSIPLPAPALEVAPARAPAPRAAEPKPSAALPALPRTPSALLRSLSEATSRDEVVRLALRGLLFVARRVAVFAVKREGFHGWACNADFGDLDALRALQIPQEVPSVLATAAVTGLYLGPIPATVAHGGLIQIMKQRSTEVAASAVRVGGRPAMILFADELTDAADGTRYMEELSRAVGDALSRLLSGRA